MIGDAQETPNLQLRHFLTILIEYITSIHFLKTCRNIYIYIQLHVLVLKREDHTALIELTVRSIGV